MASEIRANSITSRAGLSTVTMTDSGPMFSGITTFVDNSGFTFGVGGGTSIFTPATNVLTFGTNNTEKIRIDASGNTNISGITTASNFKTGSSNLHSTGLTVGNALVHSTGINVGTGATVHSPASNVLTLGTNSNERVRVDSSGRLLVGTGAAANPKSSGAGSIDLDNQAFSIMVGGNHPSGGRSDNNAKTFRMSMVHYTLAEEPINILQGYCDNSDNNVYIGGGTGSANSLTSVRIYTGANNTTTGGTERFRIHSAGQIGLSGANYGSSGQVLTSGGSGSAATWSTVSGTTINNNASDRIITGSGTANTLEAQANVTFNSPQLRVNAGNTSSIQVDGLYSYMQAAGVRLWRGAGNRSHNMGCGANTLANASGGQDCTALGHNALTNSTSGSANTALGSHSMVGTVTGSNNVAVGHGALNKNTSGYNNTVVGRIAGLENLGGHNNTFLGMDAGTNNTSGNNNIYGGSGAGKFESTSTDNVAIGWNCFGGERSGGNSNQFNKNTVVGHQALAQQRIANGDGENVCIGYRAMYNVTTGGWRNCIIGYQAGFTQNGASYNTFLGTFAGYNYTSGGNTMCLGYNAGTANSPSGALTTNQDTICLGNDAISNFYCNDTSISSSDARDKTDITEWTHGLSFINQLKPITYRWDKRTWYGTDEEPIGTPDGSKKKERLHLGFLAQDALAVEQSFGYASKKDDMLAVNLNEDGSAYGMKYERLVVPLTKAVQELSAKVETLEQENIALRARVTNLEGN